MWEAAPKRSAPGFAGAARRPAGDEAAGAEPAPPAAPPRQAAPPRPATPPRRQHGSLRVNALLAGAGIVLLLLGFLLGATLTHDETPGAARPPPTQAPLAAPPSTAAPGAVPRACSEAMERADQVISYLIGNIRDQRLSKSLQEFVDSRRACQQAVSR